ncbi:hypothetical protein Aoki45_33300 [Algoriphagus sp. oki45]|uniref:glycosyltransferase family 10 domain-containing protein n=1 Tax=Algoriphagus sp. oki45 TaxID=3067294 RepID=UPI0027FE41D3|nr:hypothetical protein Aoki45_33300 [Algoriphagus sp. oki45]
MKLRVDFVDFYKELNKENNFFINILREVCDVEVSNNPDLIFYSNYGVDNLKYSCYKIFYSAENIRPDYRFCDFSLTFDYLDDKRNFRLPLYCIHLKDFNSFVKEKNLGVRPKNKFCNFVYSNEKAKERIEFFKILSKYKKIDSPGKVLNNMPTSFSGIRYDYKSKLEFLSNYKFTIAFENESYPGYTTEKIIHPLLVGSIPIYWGNPMIAEDFDENLFINVHNFQSFEEVVERVIEIDMDRNKSMEFLPDSSNFEKILNGFEVQLTDFFEFVVSNMHQSPSISSSFLGRNRRIFELFSMRGKNALIKFNKLFR